MCNDQGTISRISTRALWVLTALAVIAMLSGCAREREAVVARRDIVAYVSLSGETGVPPAASANVGAPYEAPVDRVYVTVGQSVRQGDVLVSLSAPQTEAFYQQARQRLLQARRQLAQAQERCDAQTATARRNLEQARQAERVARREAQEIPEATTSQVNVIVTENPDLAAAIERRQQAEQALLDARARCDANLAPHQQRLVEAQQQFQDAQAGLKGAQVRTPISGTVLAINAESGQVVGGDRQTTVVRVVDLSAVKVYAPTSRESLNEVQPKRPAVVTVAEIPNEEFMGQVEQVYTREAGLPWDAEHVTVVDFHNRGGLVKPGMKATASVKVGEVENALAVPASAVYESDGRPTVKVQRDEEWHEREVEAGLTDGRYTEIRSGLNEGDVVLANP